MFNPLHWPLVAFALNGFAVFVTWIVVLVTLPRPPALGQRWTPRERRRALILTLAMIGSVLIVNAIATQRSLLKMRDDARATLAATYPSSPIIERTESIGPFATARSVTAIPQGQTGDDLRIFTHTAALGPADYAAPFIHCAIILAIAWAIRGIAALIRTRRRRSMAPSQFL